MHKKCVYGIKGQDKVDYNVRKNKSINHVWEKLIIQKKNSYF